MPLFFYVFLFWEILIFVWYLFPIVKRAHGPNRRTKWWPKPTHLFFCIWLPFYVLERQNCCSFQCFRYILIWFVHNIVIVSRIFNIFVWAILQKKNSKKRLKQLFKQFKKRAAAQKKKRYWSKEGSYSSKFSNLLILILIRF